MTPLALAALGLAIVTQNQSALRASPRETAPQQAVLWQGEVLEVRGERGEYLSVYDHRLERAGFIRAAQVRATSLQPEEAPQLLAVVRFLRDTPGAEALGISYAAAYLKAVPAAQMSAEPFDALGSMAERMALRASIHQSKANSTIIAAHLELVAQFGIKFNSYEHNGTVQICYDGDMYRRVLAMSSAEPAQQARAALGLTRHDCVDPNLGPTARYQWDQWRADILQGVRTASLSATSKNRLHMRRAGVLAALAFWQTRRGENALAAANQSLEELGAVKKSDLEEVDQNDYAEAAVRVGASRLAAEPAGARNVAANCSPSAAPLAQSGYLRLAPARTALPWRWRFSRSPRGAKCGCFAVPAASGWSTCCRRAATGRNSAISSSPAGSRTPSTCWWFANFGRPGTSVAGSNPSRSTLLEPSVRRGRPI
jgi:hypothetical protein